MKVVLLLNREQPLVDTDSCLKYFSKQIQSTHSKYLISCSWQHLLPGKRLIYKLKHDEKNLFFVLCGSSSAGDINYFIIEVFNLVSIKINK